MSTSSTGSAAAAAAASVAPAASESTSLAAGNFVRVHVELLLPSVLVPPLSAGPNHVRMQQLELVFFLGSRP
jgi:hypothetical protein